MVHPLGHQRATHVENRIGIEVLVSGVEEVRDEALLAWCCNHEV